MHVRHCVGFNLPLERQRQECPGVKDLTMEYVSSLKSLSLKELKVLYSNFVSWLEFDWQFRESPRDIINNKIVSLFRF